MGRAVGPQMRNDTTLKCCQYCLDLKYEKQPTKQPKKVCPHSVSHRTVFSKLDPQPLYRKPNTSNWLENKMILCSLLFCCHLDIWSGKHKTRYPFHLSFLTQIMFLTKSTYYWLSTPRTKVPDPSRTYTPTIIMWWYICQATRYSHTLKLTERFSL